jgi:hypothetical protein
VAFYTSAPDVRAAAGLIGRVWGAEVAVLGF